MQRRPVVTLRRVNLLFFIALSRFRSGILSRFAWSEIRQSDHFLVTFNVVPASYLVSVTEADRATVSRTDEDDRIFASALN